MPERKRVAAGIAVVGIGVGVTGLQDPLVGSAIIVGGLLIAFWPSRWIPERVLRSSGAGRAREVLIELGPSLEAMLAGADEVWVRLSYDAKRNFGPPLDKPLIHLIDKADARERRKARRVASELIGRLRGGDPRPFIVPTYTAYREWRDEIIKLARMMGVPVMHLEWADAERRFFEDLGKELESPVLRAEQRAVREYDAEHGPPGPLSRD